MANLTEIQQRVAGQAIVRNVDQIAHGHVRIETAFLYPEGGTVDLFIPVEHTSRRELCLSDLGRTMEWLLDVQIRPWRSKERQSIVDDALRLYGVRQKGGALELPLASLDDLVPGIIRLGQACIRVADLIYTRRSSLQTPATEALEDKTNPK